MPGKSDNSAFDARFRSTAFLPLRPSLIPCATALESRLRAAVPSAVFSRIWSGVAFGEHAKQTASTHPARTPLKARVSMLVGCRSGSDGWVSPPNIPGRHLQANVHLHPGVQPRFEKGILIYETYPSPDCDRSAARLWSSDGAEHDSAEHAFPITYDSGTHADYTRNTRGCSAETAAHCARKCHPGPADKDG